MALDAAIDWEIRTDGAATNGGGYKRTAGTTDYSQQAAAQLAVTDAACSDGSTTVTSATGGFTAAMVGNVCYIGGGANFLAGWYEIKTRSDTNTITVDRDPTDVDGGDATGGALNVGGALNGIGTMGLVLSTAAQAISGMRAYIRGGTYSLSGTTVNIDGGPLDLDASQQDSKSFLLKGYATDAANRDAYTGTRPVIDCNNQAPASVVELKGISDEPHTIAFVDILGDADMSRNIIGIYGNTVGIDRAIDCIVRDCDGDFAFRVVNAIGCLAQSCAATGYSAMASHCVADACEVGFSVSSGTACVNCIARNCTSDGYVSAYGMLVNCVSYNSTGDGFDETGDRASVYINCISYSDGGYSFNTCVESALFNCASDGASSGRVNVAPMCDLNPVTITGDPFADAANLDFSLDNTASQGAACRAAGLDPYGQTGHIDIGAVQHQDPASTGGGGAVILSGYGQIGVGVH